MKVIGLTGSIGMGKTTTAALFAEAGAPVHDADAEVHQLYDVGGAAVAAVGAAFPGVVRDGRVDRKALSAQVVGDSAALRALEQIVHPMMSAARSAFFEKAKAAGADVVVLDVPLLFETGGDERVDVTVVVSAPADVQRERVLGRAEMSPEKFEAILERQLPDAEKRRRADYVIETGAGIEAARAQVLSVLETVRRGPRS